MRRLLVALVSLPLFVLTFSVFAQDTGDSNRSGEDVFDASCAKCHTGGIGGFFSGAPDIDDTKDWQSALPKGLDGLTATTMVGIGKMEARGGCKECSDEEIQAAVAYMLEKLQ